MGDRCYVTLRCRKEHLKLIEEALDDEAEYTTPILDKEGNETDGVEASFQEIADGGESQLMKLTEEHPEVSLWGHHNEGGCYGPPRLLFT